VAISPDGAVAYVTPAFGKMAVIDTASNTVSATIDIVGSLGGGLALSPDGESVYVASPYMNTVYVIAHEFSYRAPDLVGRMLGPGGSDAGFLLLVGNHLYRIPPRPLALAMIAEAPFLGDPIENPELVDQIRRLVEQCPQSASWSAAAMAGG
jgi:hypothetical protein